jgi:hypothetical protein
MKLCQRNNRNTQNLEAGDKRKDFPPSDSFRVFGVFRWHPIRGLNANTPKESNPPFGDLNRRRFASKFLSLRQSDGNPTSGSQCGNGR